MLRQFMDSALKSLTGTVDKLTKTKFKLVDSGIQLVTNNMHRPSVSPDCALQLKIVMPGKMRILFWEQP